MILVTILMAIALLLVSAVESFVTYRQYKSGRAPARFARHYGLSLPDGFEATLRRNVNYQALCSFIGTAVCLAIATSLVLIAATQSWIATFWCVLGGYIVGASIGRVVGTLIAESHRERGIVRVGRLRAVRTADYIPSFRIWSARVVTVLAVAAFIVDCIIGASTPELFSIPSGVFAVLAVLTLVFFEFTSRRIVSRGALAGSPLELAWDDAFRSIALAQLVWTPLVLGLYSFVAYDTLAYSAKPLVGNPAIAFWVDILPLLCVAILAVWIIATSYPRARQYYLRRLWPELAAADNSAPPASGVAEAR